MNPISVRASSFSLTWDASACSSPPLLALHQELHRHLPPSITVLLNPFLHWSLFFSLFIFLIWPDSLWVRETKEGNIIREMQYRRGSAWLYCWLYCETLLIGFSDFNDLSKVVHWGRGASVLKTMATNHRHSTFEIIFMCICIHTLTHNKHFLSQFWNPFPGSYMFIIVFWEVYSLKEDAMIRVIPN